MSRLIPAKPTKRLLIVDDNAGIRAAFEAEAWDSGLFSEITTAEDGAGAIERLRVQAEADAAELPDVILIDLYMPDMNGVELVCALRRNPALCAMRRIVVSGRDGPEERHASHLAGCHEFMKKPGHGESLAPFMRALAGPGAQHPDLRTEVLRAA